MAVGASPKVAFTTLGCRLNQAESDQMADDLYAHGLQPDADGSPDVVVINTCTVTREATKASRTAIRRAVRDNPRAKVVVIGCYAVSDPDEIAAIDGVDLVLDNHDKERLAEVLGGRAETRPLLQLGMRAKPVVPAVRRIRANLKAQTGCDEFCTFCIIPKTRGALRSMDEDSLLTEARGRVAAGAREVVLTGVHLGKYTYDSGGDERSLIRLFTKLLAIDGLWRIRLSSILSRHLTDELVGLIASEPRMCAYLHVPLQSGDDGVLRAMNRPYTIEGYVESMERAAAAIPALATATDIIVGFPGESEDAFEHTMDVVRRIGFSKLHVFRYSARPDTPAAEMSHAVPPDVKKERSKRLITLGNELRSRFLNDHLSHPLDVLVEDERTVEGSSICSGQTGDHVRVWFEGQGLLGSEVRVRGHEVRSDGIRGADVLEVIRR